MANSDSDDLEELLNPLNGLRKNSSRLSQCCDTSTASTTFHSNIFNKRNSKLSLSQRKRFFPPNTTKQVNQLEESYTLDQSVNIDISKTSNSVHEEPAEETYSDVDINGNAPKKSKLSPCSSSQTTFKVEALQLSESPKAESEFSAVVDLVSTNSSSQNTVPLVIPNDLHNSPDRQVNPKENVPPFSTPVRNANEDPFPKPPTVSPVTFMPCSNHSSFSKNEIVQKWLESTDVQTITAFEDKSEEDEQIPTSLVIGADEELLSKGLESKDPILEISSVSILSKKHIEVPKFSQTLPLSQKAKSTTPKRKRGPSTPRSSDGKVTPQITSYFSPLKETPAKSKIRELSSPNHGESCAPSTIDKVVDSTENGNVASTSSAKEQWAKLMPKLRGTAENVQREI